jgi:hypothetical protein
MRMTKILFHVFYICIGFSLGCSSGQPWKDAKIVSRRARIQPDYSGITIPPNIAPLNFLIKEPGTLYRVEIRGSAAPSIQIHGKSPSIRIPINAWKRFLSANRGNSYQVKIFLKDSTENWLSFSPITNKIAPDSIDSYLAYRRLGPLHAYFKKMGI